MSDKFQLREFITSSVGRVLIDTSYEPDDKFRPYETMVFGINHKGIVNYQDPLDTQWYQTEEDAREGHKETVKKWRI